MAEQQAQYLFGDAEQDRLRLETQTKVVVRYLKRHAREFAGDDVQRILDLGCGEGQLGFTLQATYPGSELVGIDRDPHAAEKAQQIAQQKGLTAQFVAGDVQADLPAGPFDLVLASNILVHLQQPAQAVREVFERLSSGGTFLIIEPAPNLAAAMTDPDMRQLLGLVMTTMARIGGHPNLVADLPAMLQEVGFVDYTRHEREDDHPYSTHNAEEEAYVRAAGIGVMYNARQGIAKVTGTPVEQIEAMIVKLMNKGVEAVVAGSPPNPVITVHKP